MKPNPPLSSEAPLPDVASRKSSWRKWKWVFGFIAIGSFAIWLRTPVVIRSKRCSEQVEAISNARQISMALFEFEVEYGSYPDAISSSNKKGKSGTVLPRVAKTSNDYFLQLFASGIVRSETMFFAEIAGARRADSRIDGSQALQKGECGFSYLVGLAAAGNPARPLLVTPLIPGTDRFDPVPFQGKAVVLRMDGSVTSLSIEKDGHVMFLGGNLLDPKNPVWGSNDHWTIAWPDL